MSLFSEQSLRSKLLAGIISESKYDSLVKERQNMENASLGFDREVYGIKSLNESVSLDESNGEVSDDNIIKTMDTALKGITGDLEGVLTKALSQIGDKDGEIDIAENIGIKTKDLEFDEEVYNQNINEGGDPVSLALGLAMSPPAIMQTGGKIAGWLGKKLNQGWLEKIGGRVAKAGDNLHHKYIHFFEKIVRKFVPQETSDEQVHKIAEAMMMGIVGILFAMGVANPGALEAVKGQELAGYVKKVLPSILPKLGIA